MKKAFTLIELLIVVAIIAILAAIAVPNFLEAQVRSKVSRVKADLRTENTGLESYQVDNNCYPPCNSFGTALYNGVSGGRSLEFLSSPIAYLTTALVKDVFKVSYRLTGATASAIQTATPIVVPPTDQAGIQNSYIYASWSTTQRIATDSPPSVGDIKARSWLLHSAGPDQTYYNLGGVLATDALPSALQYTIDMIYDPTNGTVSRGSIWRSGGQGGGNQAPYVGGTALVSAIQTQR